MAGMMFYKNIDLLDVKKYGKSKIERISDYSFTAEANSLPITGSEFIQASKEYIIAFIKNDEGEYFPMVCLGVEDQKNLYVTKEGKWNAKYIPGYVRRYPFASMVDEEGEKFNICIDESYPGLGTEKGQPLFQEDGTPAPIVEDVIKILQEYHGQMKYTSDFCKRLADNDLLESKVFQAEVSTQDGGKKFQLSGVFVINEEKLLGLDDNIALDFFKKGEFSLIYSHLISLNNFSRMLDRYFAE
jgi:hypothetical protein